MAVLALNFIADFYDILEQYHLPKAEEEEDASDHKDSEVKAKPSCSVLIKHLPESGDILLGHNTWHEYRAMEYRSDSVRLCTTPLLAN